MEVLSLNQPQWAGGLPGLSVSPWAGGIHRMLPVLLPAHVAHQGAEQVCLNESELVHLNLPAEPSGPLLR